MSSLRVLITNRVLGSGSGTEMYVRDLALGLLDAGHLPIVYTPRAGALADELRRATVPITSDLATITVLPDVIHGHHILETYAALARFPDTPAVFVCHDWSAWHDIPPRFDRVRRYVAVDHTCRDRLVTQCGIPETQVEVIYNAVDLRRFPQRGALPEIPRRALVFSNYATPAEFNTIAAACHRHGMTCDGAGRQLGQGLVAPEQRLGNYDLVLAKGRCAREAMAVGAAVIVCDLGRTGPLVTAAEFERLQRANFGRRLLSENLCGAAIRREIERYSAHDAGEVSRCARRTGGLEPLVESFVELYHDIIHEHTAAGPQDPSDELQSHALAWQWVAGQVEQFIAAAADQEYRNRLSPAWRLKRFLKKHSIWPRRRSA